MTFAEALRLPTGWSVTHIISIGHDWQITAISDEYVVVATGETIESALESVGAKIFAEEYLGRIYDGPIAVPEFESHLSLAQRLGLVPKAPVITRRL